MTTTDGNFPTRYRTALGDHRETAIACHECKADTYALDALCDECFTNGLEPGDELTITIEAGVLRHVDAGGFAGSVPPGTVGRFAGKHPNPRLGEWLVVEVPVELAVAGHPGGLDDVDGLVVAPLHPGHVTKVAR